MCIRDRLSRIKPPFELLDANVIQIDYFGPRIGIINLEVDYLYKNEKYHERIFLIGRAVYILVIFKCKDDNELYTILVSQPRIGSGTFSLEIPAGMLDDSNAFIECAIRELEEEVHITAKDDEMIELSDFNFTIPELCDDNSKYYLYYKEETKENIMKFDNMSTGAEEDEVITLKVSKFKEAMKCATESVSLYCMKIFESKLANGELKL